MTSSAWNARKQWKRRAVWLVLLLASRAIAQPSASDAPQAVRVEFFEAYTAAQLGLGSAESDSPALKSYALYSYVNAARLAYVLQRASAGPSDADRFTEDFLRAHGREPVTAPLRRSWLESLARRAEWQQCRCQHRDTRVRAAEREDCAEANIRARGGDRGALARAVPAATRVRAGVSVAA
jgi:hypothetical protein